MKSENAIEADWRELDNVDKILNAIRHHEIDMRQYLAETIAALCDVDIKLMLGDCDKVYVAQARWMFWYAYRYMSGDTFKNIARLTSQNNGGVREYTANAVGAGFNKMSQLIRNDAMWQKRWTIIKRIIKLREPHETANADNTIVINVPKELKDQIKIEIKDK